MTAESTLLDESFADIPEPLDFSKLFGNCHPVELEIGSGKGTFLVHRAKARPELNFLGIEWARPYCSYAAHRLSRWGLRNVRMLRTDARTFLRNRVSSGSLQRVHIYFPDPWPKAKQRKRRIIQPGFIQLLHSKLIVGGQLAVITDHRNYARQIAWAIYNTPGYATVPFGRTHGAEDGEVVGTNFERKYIGQGRSFFALAVMKWR